jgi:hypothetical protein
LASHTRFFSFRTAKQFSLTCCIFMEIVPSAVFVAFHAL